MKALTKNRTFFIKYGTESFDEVETVHTQKMLRGVLKKVTDHYPMCKGFYLNVTQFDTE